MGGFRAARANAAIVLVAVASGCDPAAPVPAPSTSAPVVEASQGTAESNVVVLLPTPSPPVPLDRCPETRGSQRPEPLPASLPVGETDHWYGAGPLWVDLSRIVTASIPSGESDGRRYRVRWKAFVDGDLIARASRLDAPGDGQIRVFPAYAEGHSFWIGDLSLPAAGCWLVTARVDGVSLGFVMRSA